MKIRTDFVTNSSSSSFVACGVLSQELADFIRTLLNGKDSAYAKYSVGGLDVDGDIISMVTTLDSNDFYYLNSIDFEYQTRTKKQQDADDACARKPYNVVSLIKEFLPDLSAAEKNELSDLVEQASQKGGIIARTYIDETDGFEWVSFGRKEFVYQNFQLDDQQAVVKYKEISEQDTLVIPAFTHIKENAFRHCKITKNIIAERRVSWDSGALAYCQSLEHLCLDSGSNILPKRLCEGCTALKEVQLPENLYRIDGRAFYGCANLEKINIPETVLYIDATAFEGCEKLPADVQEKICQLSDKDAFDKIISDAEQYIQTHGDAKYRFDHRYYGPLFVKKAKYEKWYDIHESYFDTPETLPGAKTVYSVFAEKGVAIDMSAYAWKQQKTLTTGVEYLIVDTATIPKFDRFCSKQDALEAGDLEKAKNFGTNMLEKAIELKQSGHPIQIITRAYLEACIAANAFEEMVVGPTKAELRAMEAQKEREAKKAKKADAFEQVMLALQAHCSSTGKKFENLSEVNEFAQNLGVTLENYKRKIQQEHNMTQGEYYAHLGILSTAKTRFQEMLLTLAERYRSAGKKVETFGQLVDENPDLEVQLIRNYAQSFAGLAARELLIKEGIMYNDEELVAQKAPSAVAQKDPAQIPENIRKRMDTLFAKLDAAYPDKVIVRLNADHKEWAKTVTDLYRALGYASPSEFLAAYGYQQGVVEDKGGRPKKDPMEIINELKRRYPNGSDFMSVDELKAANPDIASRFQSLKNKSNEHFGMPFTKYLRSIGLIK